MIYVFKISIVAILVFLTGCGNYFNVNNDHSLSKKITANQLTYKLINQFSTSNNNISQFISLPDGSLEKHKDFIIFFKSAINISAEQQIELENHLLYIQNLLTKNTEHNIIMNGQLDNNIAGYSLAVYGN